MQRKLPNFLFTPFPFDFKSDDDVVNDSLVWIRFLVPLDSFWPDIIGLMHPVGNYKTIILLKKKKNNLITTNGMAYSLIQGNIGTSLGSKRVQILLSIFCY